MVRRAATTLLTPPRATARTATDRRAPRATTAPRAARAARARRAGAARERVRPPLRPNPGPPRRRRPPARRQRSPSPSRPCRRTSHRTCHPRTRWPVPPAPLHRRAAGGCGAIRSSRATSMRGPMWSRWVCRASLCRSSCRSPSRCRWCATRATATAPTTTTESSCRLMSTTASCSAARPSGCACAGQRVLATLALLIGLPVWALLILTWRRGRQGRRPPPPPPPPGQWVWQPEPRHLLRLRPHDRPPSPLAAGGRGRRSARRVRRVQRGAGRAASHRVPGGVVVPRRARRRDEPTLAAEPGNAVGAHRRRVDPPRRRAAAVADGRRPDALRDVARAGRAQVRPARARLDQRVS